MRVPEEYVRLLHRIFGVKAGQLTIRKEGGHVVEVSIDGRTLDPREWKSLKSTFHVEHRLQENQAERSKVVDKDRTEN